MNGEKEPWPKDIGAYGEYIDELVERNSHVAEEKKGTVPEGDYLVVAYTNEGDYLVVAYTNEGGEEIINAFKTYSEAFRAMEMLLSTNLSYYDKFASYGLRKRSGVKHG